MTLQGEDELATRHTKSFLGHLEDLRRVLIFSFAVLLAGMCAAIPIAPWVIKVLKQPLMEAGRNPDEFLWVTSMSSGISLTVSVVLWTGLLLSVPFILLAFGWFIFPGLTKKERKTALVAAFFAVLLFAAGVALGYFTMLGVTVKVLLDIIEWLGGKCQFIELGDYISVSLQLLICIGLAFEIPLVLVVLGSLGIVSSRQLGDKRRHAIVVLLIIAAAITPTPDPFTMFVVALPMTVLYEACIWVVWAMERRGKRES